MAKGVNFLAQGLVCFDMDRVLIDHMSNWQWVYDKLGVNNDEAFALYNSGKLDEWDWIILDLALIKDGCMKMLGEELRDEHLRGWIEDAPLMKGWRECIDSLLNADLEVAIISGGMQQTARQISCAFPSNSKWQKRWGGIDPHNSRVLAGGMDTRLHVFTNGWLSNHDGSIPTTGRYQVQMGGKNAIVQMLQRRLGVTYERTVSIGDSPGDIAMFTQSGYAINFNPWDERTAEHSDLIIEEKDLALVADAIHNYLGTK
ncbi:MAG TPA: hypothetical protein EYQ53_03800 [Candidatus Poseidoniales archaeon]|jgi:phosphoserine phosphatase|nr:MAG: hypothetical protein CXT69_01065 [Euryarchaeota archaeon]HIG03488.1 hypothetical protein [Candidatus Poseidoniales archaeon]HIK77781.1 hypothetical protein [Candidatus Poseidoniales archaeon]